MSTPEAPRYYCLKVQLHSSDYLKPKNDLGQVNTNVGAAQSPTKFTFPVRNVDVAEDVYHWSRAEEAVVFFTNADPRGTDRPQTMIECQQVQISGLAQSRLESTRQPTPHPLPRPGNIHPESTRDGRW